MSADWKVRQFVPDSDDDSDTENLDVLQEVEQGIDFKVDGGSTINNESIQAEDSCILRDEKKSHIVHEAGRELGFDAEIQATAGSGQEIRSTTSSALSSVASTPSYGFARSPNGSVPLDSPDLPVSELPELLQIATHHDLSRSPGRFRHRKAIQLNPYAIENQMYKQSWKARGLAPLMVKNQNQSQREDDPDVSSSELDQDSQSADEVLLDDSQMMVSGVEFDLGTMSPIDFEEEELADVRRGTAGPLNDSQQQSVKRRKTAHTYSKRDKNQPASTNSAPLFPVRGDGWIEVPFAADKSHSKDTQAIAHFRKGTVKLVQTRPSMPQEAAYPLSPIETSPALPRRSPKSSSHSPEYHTTDEVTTPLQLRTPRLSSGNRSSRIKAARHPGAATSETYLPDPPLPTWQSVDSEELSEQSSSEDMTATVTELMKAQRRTRGVLPASWHRLEYQKLLNKQQQPALRPVEAGVKRRTEHSSPSKEARKGVAKRILTKPTQEFMATDLTTLLPLDPESDDEKDETHELPKEQHNIDNYFTIDDSDDDMNMEDNSIDIMAGGRGLPRPRKAGVSVKRTQTKISDTMRGGYRETSDNVSRARHTEVHTQKRTQQQMKFPKSKASKRNIGILDATRHLDRTNTPNFIGVATRTARKRKDKARHSPSRKHIHLQDAKDASDVKDTLQDWDKSTTHRSHHRASLHRLPLHERSENNPRRQAFLLDDESDEEENRTARGRILRTADINKQIEHLVTQRNVASAVPGQSIKKPATRTGYPTSSTLHTDHGLMPAQLEAEKLKKRQHVALQDGQSLQLVRYLHEDPVTHKSTLSLSRPSRKTPNSRRVVKGTPRQVLPFPSMDTDEYENTERPVLSSPDQDSSHALPLQAGALPGLPPYGLELPTDFNVRRLPSGQLFGQETLLGSHLFADSLCSRLDNETLAPFSTVINSRTTIWDMWNRKVANEIFELCHEALNVTTTVQHDGLASAKWEELLLNLRSIIAYLSKHLRFEDSADCVEFAQDWTIQMRKFAERLTQGVKQRNPKLIVHDYTIQVAGSLAIISQQVSQLASSCAIDSNVKSSLLAALDLVLGKALQAIFNPGFEAFRLFLGQFTDSSTSKFNTSRACQVENFAIVAHLSSNRASVANSVWEVMRQEEIIRTPPRVTFPTLELVWKNLFGLLPILEIDHHGNVPDHTHTTNKLQNWRLVKQLIEPVLKAYSQLQSQSILDRYCRKLYVRCFLLINDWDWDDCESILVLLFDFFAQHRLVDLRSEISHESPSFLENLTTTTTLTVERFDTCFHVLLKVIGRGLKAMRSRSTVRKIGNCIWRLTPNHDRCLPKDKELRQEDLDAVRNHLDLLLVLYWAAPPEQRIRIDVIRRLIDIEDSHKEVCFLVVLAWKKLTNFQLSTLESAESLTPLMGWFDEIINKALRLHRLARSEVENDARLARISYGHHFTSDQQEKTIEQSQTHAESILTSALSSLETLLNAHVDVTYMEKILPSSLNDVFDLLDVSNSRTSPILVRLLRIVAIWSKCTMRGCSLAETYSTHDRRVTEDSQEFGDWQDVQDLNFEMDQARPMKLPHSLDHKVQQFVTDLFGSDGPVDDEVLHAALQCWLDVKKLDILAERLTWSDLIDPYSQSSWSFLRDTSHTRRYTPLFYAEMLKSDPTNQSSSTALLISNSMNDMSFRYDVLKFWVRCLVERESYMKYEPHLTATLLNHVQMRFDPILQNLPFREDAGVFKVATADFLARRLSLISCLLSNMRESLSFSEYHQLEDCQEKRRNYASLIRSLMAAMQHNCKERITGGENGEDYVTFVQSIVQSLQEHTSDICKVDDFFLDAVNIPLPINDPEYLVGKLGHLALLLHQSGGPQKLAAFIQSLCERATIEARPQKFASLLAKAMTGNFDGGHQSGTILRYFICCHILPIYLDTIANTACGSIVAQTVLLSIPAALHSLPMEINTCDISSITAIQEVILTVVRSVGTSMMNVFHSSSVIHDHRMLTTISRYFDILESTLIVLDYTSRSCPDPIDNLTDLLVFFKDSALVFRDQYKHGNYTTITLPVLRGSDLHNHPIPDNFAKARSFTKESLNASLDPYSSKCKWRFDNERLYVHRNGSWEQLHSDFSTTSVQLQGLMNSLGSFLAKLRVMPSFAWMLDDNIEYEPSFDSHEVSLGFHEDTDPVTNDLVNFF